MNSYYTGADLLTQARRRSVLRIRNAIAAAIGATFAMAFAVALFLELTGI